MLTYSARLAFTLLAGTAEVPEALRERYAAYLLRTRNPDGGWSGREASAGTAALAGLPLRIAVNPQPESGQASSLVIGMGVLPAGTEHETSRRRVERLASRGDSHDA